MCHNAKRIRVQIENPVPGCQSSTSLERARRYERQQRAVFTAPLVIRFVACDRRNLAAAQQAQRSAARYIDGLASLDGLRNTPVIKPVRLLTGKRPKGEVREDRIIEISSRRVVYAVNAQGKLQELGA